MSSLQQPAQKRPRCESNNTSINSSKNNCNTNINLLSLPDEALDNIISYSIPRTEYQYEVWEWIGILNQTCRSFRRFAQTYAPTRIVLEDFVIYYTYSNGNEGCVDYRVEFLRSLRDCSWKRQHLKELHVNHEAVLQSTIDGWGHERRSRECSEEIKALLRNLLTTQTSFPELEWLDIELQSDDVDEYDLINAKTLRLMPDAFPALHKLCLSQCFKYDKREISPYRLKRFFTNLQTPLVSLSMCSSSWMTDAHVEAIMPIIGKNLVVLNS